MLLYLEETPTLVASKQPIQECVYNIKHKQDRSCMQISPVPIRCRALSLPFLPHLCPWCLGLAVALGSDARAVSHQ